MEECGKTCTKTGCSKKCIWTKADHKKRPTLMHVCTGNRHYF